MLPTSFVLQCTGKMTSQPLYHDLQDQTSLTRSDVWCRYSVYLPHTAVNCIDHLVSHCPKTHHPSWQSARLHYPRVAVCPRTDGEHLRLMKTNENLIQNCVYNIQQNINTYQ